MNNRLKGTNRFTADTLGVASRVFVTQDSFVLFFSVAERVRHIEHR